MEPNLMPHAHLILGIVSVVAGAAWYSLEKWVLKVDMFRTFGGLIFYVGLIIAVDSSIKIFSPEFPIAAREFLKSTAVQFGW